MNQCQWIRTLCNIPERGTAAEGSIMACSQSEGHGGPHKSFGESGILPLSQKWWWLPTEENPTWKHSMPEVKRECRCRVVRVCTESAGYYHRCNNDCFTVQHVGDCARTGELREALRKMLKYAPHFGTPWVDGYTKPEYWDEACDALAEAKRVLGEK